MVDALDLLAFGFLNGFGTVLFGVMVAFRILLLNTPPSVF